jgi:hypothetical protein
MVAKNNYHYTRTEEKWRLTHHLIAEEKLGRPLHEDERVVFRDRDRTNLNPDNIEVRRRTTTTLRKKRAQLSARAEEIAAKIAAIDQEIESALNVGKEEDVDS